MHYRKMTKNYIFRKFECGLSKEETAELCFKTVRVVTGWDCGRQIPPECRRLMRLAKSRELSPSEKWCGFRMVKDKLEIPTGQQVSPQELLTAVALLSINSELEINTSSKLLKIARALANVHKINRSF
ncbi:regulator [Vibrio fluvialis]|uniref:regulator n=1 Tax=Vibrio fluvialis TaxID=676 RepID=UPI001F229499|nr:regulator [Vibrio fluvialis]MCE7604564.1 regulator [Vibrio fluvialis]